MEMGEKIYNLRVQKGLTLEELGDMVGVGKSTVRKWENGIIANMKRDKILKVSEALDTTPAYLMGWKDKEPSEEHSPIEIGNRIKYARDLRGATLDNIAKKVGVTKSTIQRYESGKIITIKLPVVEAIAIALNVNPSWVIGKSDDMEIPLQKIPNIMQYYSQLNDLGKQEAEKRVEELTHLPKYTKESESGNNTVAFSEEFIHTKDYLLPNAAHADESLTEVTEEMIQAEENIMDDENF